MQQKIKINNEKDILLHVKKIQMQKKQAEKLQKEYDFLIPDYVLSEIVMQTDNQNAFALINLAKFNNRISEKNANILKEKLR